MQVSNIDFIQLFLLLIYKYKSLLYMKIKTNFILGYYLDILISIIIFILTLYVIGWIVNILLKVKGLALTKLNLGLEKIMFNKRYFCFNTCYFWLKKYILPVKNDKAYFTINIPIIPSITKETSCKDIELIKSWTKKNSDIKVLLGKLFRESNTELHYTLLNIILDRIRELNTIIKDYQDNKKQ